MLLGRVRRVLKVCLKLRRGLVYFGICLSVSKYVFLFFFVCWLIVIVLLKYRIIGVNFCSSWVIFVWCFGFCELVFGWVWFEWFV